MHTSATRDEEDAARGHRRPVAAGHRGGAGELRQESNEGGGLDDYSEKEPNHPGYATRAITSGSQR